MKIDIKILLIILVVFVCSVIYFTFKINSLNKDVSGLKLKIKQQHIAAIVSADSIASVENNKIQVRMDSLITSLQNKRTTIKAKEKKQDATLNTINAAGIVLPNF